MGQEGFGSFPVGSTRGRCKRMRRTMRLVASLGTAVLLACAVVTAAVVGSARSVAATAERPNIVLVVTDDLTKKDYLDLGNNLQSFTSGGTFFHNAYVTTSLCSPSRASALTGLYAHNHHIIQHADPGTGYEQYNDEGYDRRDLPVWLMTKAGYKTGLVGKYMNKYDAQADGVPEGWTDWYGADDPTEHWTLNEKGTIKTYPQDPTLPGYESFENVIGDKAVKFVREAHASDKPFFLWYGTHAPHSPALIPPPGQRQGGDLVRVQPAELQRA
jgi:N-acetylglucosamine-6-sulfatase